MIWFGKQ